MSEDKAEQIEQIKTQQKALRTEQQLLRKEITD